MTVKQSCKVKYTYLWISIINANSSFMMFILSTVIAFGVSITTSVHITYLTLESKADVEYT